MKKFLLTALGTFAMMVASAQTITARWELSDKDNLSQVVLTGEEAYTSLVKTAFQLGSNIGATATRSGSDADTGYERVTYDPYFTEFKPKTRVTSKTSGHCIRFTVTPASGYVFRPTGLSFDAAKCGTDGGNVGVYYQVASGTESVIAASFSPLRNKVTSDNPNAYSHLSYTLSGVSANSQAYHIYLYIWNLNGTDNENPKSIAFRNVTLTGEVEKFYTTADFVKTITCKGKTAYGDDGQTIDLTTLTKNLMNGGLAKYGTKLYGDPSDFSLTLKEGYTSTVDVSGHVAIVKIFEGTKQVFYFEVSFVVSDRAPKPAATPLKRGLMSLSLTGAGMGTGNLISWRHREYDGYGVKYKLYRGENESVQNTKLNGGRYIIDKTNFRDASGKASSYYKLEVYDEYGNLLETEVSKKTWSNQTMNVPLAAAPKDERNGAYYTPNDASFCDMDGDGEYEIVLKWRPSNEKDAASSGTTSQAVYDCYKLDGTQLWRIQTGYNMFNSAHTTPFIAWDFDGDGYGEFMVKTAPGAIDGEGNYVLLGNDDPNENLKSSRGKQDHGSEYITVFDGMTGAELATIPYHTDYNAGLNYWGDSNQNRSERYLAAIAWLDGPDKNPCPVFARGYYSGAFVAAYDWDGVTLKERWVSRNTQSGKGLWGEGAHSITVGDCDGDGKQEIVFGSAALDDDGSLLYRTGLGHGDALHISDFLPEREGQEVFMVHEKSPYGYDLRDAKTGTFIHHVSANDDTGRGLAAHFDSSSAHSQFIYSASGAMFDCLTGNSIADSWAIGSSGASINCRIYWDGDLYDEFFDKSVLAHWNPTGKYFDRIKFNNGNYLWGELNNGSKNNPCVMGDILGDWREEIVTWSNTDMDKTKDSNGNFIYTARGDFYLCICATSNESSFRIPHLLDDLDYRAQVILQNSVYNQPPHLSFDPSVKYKGNPNKAVQADLEDPTSIEDVETDTQVNAKEGDAAIYTLQGVKVETPTTPGFYIKNSKKIYIK